MLIIFSALAAIIPMTFYLFLIWKMDKYDREPVKLVLANYLWGALGAVILAIIGSLILTSFVQIFIRDDFGVDIFSAVIIAPFVEEITKGVFLLITITSRKFDNITDGIVYGGAIGLGFGMTENFLYFLSNIDNVADWLSIVIVRTLFSGVLHLVSSATLGAFLGLSKFMNKPVRLFLGAIGLSLAMLIHSLWNLFVSFDETVFLGFLFMIASVTVFVMVFKLSLSSERKMILKELYEEVELGLIPKFHLNLLSSPERDKTGWIDEQIRIPYIKYATALAFRKKQMKHSKGSSKLYYQAEIDFYKNQISNLLSQAYFL
jgi:RsiW-degrading membrane proteinase PrsW (M82 family)